MGRTYRCASLRRECRIGYDLHTSRARCVGCVVISVVCGLLGVESGDVCGGALDSCTDEGVVGNGAEIGPRRIVISLSWLGC